MMSELKPFNSKKVSESLYKGLSQSQHNLNNRWFDLSYNVTSDDGFLVLTEIGVVLQKTTAGWIKRP